MVPMEQDRVSGATRRMLGADSVQTDRGRAVAVAQDSRLFRNELNPEEIRGVLEGHALRRGEGWQNNQLNERGSNARPFIHESPPKRTSAEGYLVLAEDTEGRRRFATIRAMPELPEVERAVRSLRPSMEGARFERVLVRRNRLRTRLPSTFAARLEGATVQALRRRGKYLVADLSTGGTLLMHLGMSGSFEVHRGDPIPFDKHDHVVFHMSSGATVVFNDPRRFGSMWLYDERSRGAAPTAGLGPEPLDEAFDAKLMAAALRGRRAPLKVALSDQRVIAGLGNIYVSEALHRARLSPLRLARTLTYSSGAPRPPLRALVRAIRDTLHHALSLDDEEDAAFRVYDREGEQCVRRGCDGRIRRIVQAGRSTFFCPRCQR